MAKKSIVTFWIWDSGNNEIWSLALSDFSFREVIQLPCKSEPCDKCIWGWRSANLQGDFSWSWLADSWQLSYIFWLLCGVQWIHKWTQTETYLSSIPISNILFICSVLLEAVLWCLITLAQKMYWLAIFLQKVAEDY